MEYTILIPLFLYYLLFFLDVHSTRKGVLPNGSNEANPIARWLIQRYSKTTLNILNISFAVFVTGAALLLPLFFGLWLIYSFAAGHLGGFLSWTPLNRFRNKPRNKTAVFLVLISVFTALGYLSAKTHMSAIS